MSPVDVPESGRSASIIDFPASPGALVIELSVSDTRAYVRVCGELDLATDGQLRTTLDSLRREGYLHLELDVAKLEFLSASGLKVLIATAEELRRAGGSLKLVSPGRMIRRILDLAGLTGDLLGD